MAKQNLLLVDADLRSVRVLEVSLRKAGYNVASAGNAKDALAMLELSRPDLVLCDTRLPTMDGFELIQELRRRPELAGIPLMILSSDVSVETKVRGLELGVEDYLTKPIYIKELLARVNIVLQRKRREGIERLENGHKRKFSGSLSDMGVVDLLQAIDHNKKSGVLYLTSGSFDGAIYFCNGAPVDAAVGALRGSRAIYRSLLWTEGTFEIDFREIDREDHVQSSMQAVLMEGLRRVDEWGRLLEQLPNLETVFDVSDTQLMARLAEIPDQINSVLREFDGQRSLWEIVDACDADDLETLNAVSKLYFEGLLYNTGRRPGDADVPEDEPESLSELSDMALPHISSGPPVITHTLAPAWGSIPSEDGSESQLIDDTLQLNIPATPKLPEGLRITPSDAPKRRKARKRKKRSGQSLPAPADTTRKHAKPSKGKAKADEADVRVVDESVAEITPSTIAPPPEQAENAALLQAEQADAMTVVVPGTSKPPQLQRSIGAGTAPPEFARASQTAIHENPTLDLSPIVRPATPPPLHSARPSLSAAAEAAAAAPALKSTAPPPLSAEAVLPDAAPDFHSDEETTEKQVSLRGSIPPPAVESYVPRKAASPPPLPYVSKPPSPGFGSHRGVTSPGFAAAPVDEETMAAAAAAISEAETAPPPLAAEQRPPQILAGAALRGSYADAIEEESIPPALRSGSPLRGSRSPDGEDEAASTVTRTSPAPYPASIPARDFEAAILASIAPPAADVGSSLDAAKLSAHPRESSTLPEHVPADAEGLRSGAPGVLSGEPSDLDQAEDSEALAADYDSVAHGSQQDSSRAAVSARDARERSAPAARASVAPDALESTSQSERSDAAARPRDASGPPLAAASIPAIEGGDTAARGMASARPGAASIPPLATASVSPAARDSSGSSRPGVSSIPPLPAAFSSPPARDASAAAPSVASGHADGVSTPPLAAASVPDEIDDAAGAASRSDASARAGRASMAPHAAASVPDEIDDAAGAASRSDASARAGRASMAPHAATSVSPAARDASAAAPSSASGRADGVSILPLAAASAPPDDRTDYASAPPLAASTVPLDENDEGADLAGMSQQATGSVAPVARGALSDVPNVDSALAGGVSSPPLMAAPVPTDDGLDDVATSAPRSEASAVGGGASIPARAAGAVSPVGGDISEATRSLSEAPTVDSERAGGASAPPIAAASVPPDERQDSDAAAALGEGAGALSPRVRDFSAPPLAAASVPLDERESAEDAAALADGDVALSAPARDFSAPPMAATSVPPDERQDSDAAAALGEGAGALSARVRDFSAPPIAAASIPPGVRESAEDDAALGDGDAALLAPARDFSAPPVAAASVVPADLADSEAVVARGAGPRRAASPPLAAASGMPEEMDESELHVFSSRTLIEGRDFAMPALAAASLPPNAMADPSDAELVQTDLPPLASAAPANDVGEQKPEEDFSDLSSPDERPSSRSIAASQERAAPPPLPSTGRRSITPHTRTSPPPLPYSRARAEAEARQFSSQPPPPGAAALSSPLPPSADLHTSPGGYIAISPEDDDDYNKRNRAPVQRTAVPPPFAPDAATPSASAEVERAPSRGVELAANSAPPRISAVTSSVRPEGTTSSEPNDLSSLSEPSAAWLRDASAPVQIEATKAEEEARDEAEAPADARTTQADGDNDQASARDDMTPSAAKAPDAAELTGPKTGEPTSTASERPRSSSQRPQKTSNVISFVPRKRAEDAASGGSGAPSEPQKTASDAAASGVSQGIWGSTSGAPGAGNAPSQAAPQQKRRISRWVQAGGAAATVALAAGLFALRARDAAPQGSLNTAVPEAVETPAIMPPTAANEAKEQALGELEALHKQAQAVPEAPPQPSATSPTAAPTGQAPGATAPTAAPTEAAPQQAAAAEPANQQTAPAGSANQQTATAEPTKQQEAPAEPAKQQPAPKEQAAKAASEPQASAAQVLSKGRSLEQRGKKQDAINLYAQAVEEGNASSQLLSRMAFLYLNQGKNALAETAAQRAADADETNSEAWIVLGAAQDGLGKKPAAQQAYRNCAQKGQGQYVTECKRMVR